MGGGNPLKRIGKEVKRGIGKAEDVAKDIGGATVDVITLGQGENIKKTLQDVSGRTAQKAAEAQSRQLAQQQEADLKKEREETARRRRAALRARRGRASLISAAQDDQGLGV